VSAHFAPSKPTPPEGSVVYPPKRNGRGEYLVWLSEAEANRLAELRRYGESYSEAVIWLADFTKTSRAGRARRNAFRAGDDDWARR
jgi:hypothetical protein